MNWQISVLTDVFSRNRENRMGGNNKSGFFEHCLAFSDENISVLHLEILT